MYIVGTMQRETQLGDSAGRFDAITSMVYGTSKKRLDRKDKCNHGQGRRTSCSSRSELHVAAIFREDGGNDPVNSVKIYHRIWCRRKLTQSRHSQES